VDEPKRWQVEKGVVLFVNARPLARIKYMIGTPKREDINSSAMNDNDLKSPRLP
jgi:hypothetical protein